MLCLVCSSRIPNSVDVICYYCNFVVCANCQVDNKGVPKRRLFHYNQITLCGGCLAQIKYNKS